MLNTNKFYIRCDASNTLKYISHNILLYNNVDKIDEIYNNAKEYANTHKLTLIYKRNAYYTIHVNPGIQTFVRKMNDIPITTLEVFDSKYLSNDYVTDLCVIPVYDYCSNKLILSFKCMYIFTSRKDVYTKICKLQSKL